MRLTILDTQTGNRKIIESLFNAAWWAEGNGACDCNRAVEMGLTDEMDAAQRQAYPELMPWQSLCYGWERFLIIETDSQEYDLDTFNAGYGRRLKGFAWKS